MLFEKVRDGEAVMNLYSQYSFISKDREIHFTRLSTPRATPSKQIEALSSVSQSDEHAKM
jgi:hypothetical protein